MIDKLFRILNVNRAEQGVATTLFVYSFAVGVGRVFTLTASQAIFLDNFSAQDLAYVYVAAALATMAASAGYLRLGKILTPSRLITANLAVLASVTGALWVVVSFVDARWPAMLLAVWFHVLFSLSNFAFWAAATAVVDIRQGKRLFSVVATGDVVAFSLGGIAILRIVPLVGTSALLLISAGGLGAALLVARKLVRYAPTAFLQRRRPDEARSAAKVSPWSNTYLRRMTVYFALSALVFVFVDNAFNDVAQDRFSDVAQLAKFFGTYSAVTAIVNFLFRSFGAGRLVNRFGILVGLAGLPVWVLLGSALVFLTGSLLPAPPDPEILIPVAAFWFMVLTRMGDKIFRGVQYSSVATLYQPLADKAPAVQATMEGLVDSAAMGSAGLVLLGLNQVFPMGATRLAVALIAICGVWVVVTFLLRQQYLSVLAGVLQRRRLTGDTLDLDRDEVLAVVRQELASPAPENVLYAMDLLESSNVQSLRVALPHLLEHAEEDVRIDVLRRVERLRALGTLKTVRRLAADSQQSVAVRAVAVRALYALDDDPAHIDPPPLESPEREVQKGAIVGLLRSGSIEAIVRAGAILLQYLESDDARDRALAAEVLRDAAIPSFHRQVRALLEDPDPTVRQAALRAAASCGVPPLWPSVIALLRETDFHWQARETLVAGNASAVPTLVKSFERAHDDRVLRLAIPAILGRIGGSETQEALWQWAELQPPEVRLAVFESLARTGFAAVGPADRGLVEDLMRREVEEAADRFQAIAELGTREDVELLVGALGQEITEIRHRIFLLLSFGQPESDALTAWENYINDDQKKRAYSLEVLDNALSADRRLEIFPILEELQLDERLGQLGRDVDPGHDHKWVVHAVADADASRHHEWTLICARYIHAALTGDRSDITPEIQEVVERTVRLRSAELFGDMPDHVLSWVAPRFEELTLEPDDLVFDVGDQGDSLFVVVRGKVCVEHRDRTLAELTENDVFGEFTVLQSAPRTARVRCANAVELLRLRQDDLYALITEEPGLARTLIQMVLRRLEENRAARRRSRYSSVSISLKPLE